MHQKAGWTWEASMSNERDRSNFWHSIIFELIPNALATAIAAVVFFFGVTGKLLDLRQDASKLVIALLAIFLVERLSFLLGTRAKIRRELSITDRINEVHTSTNEKLEKLEDIARKQALSLEQLKEVVRKIESRQGMIPLGDISTAIKKIAPLLDDAVRIRDTTFRTDSNVDTTQWNLDPWVDAFWTNISKLSSYQLIVCDKTRHYPEIFLTDKCKSVGDLPKKFRIREAAPSIAFPNFLIIHCKDRKYAVVGWPFDGGNVSNLRLVEDQEDVEYLDHIFADIWQKARPYNRNDNSQRPLN
jgi:hypothetical protein